MKILHTSDWHLGQRFINRERSEEHELVLQWLLDTLKKHAVDALIIAGDVFDTGSPPNYALRQYYRFLTQVRDTGCRHVLVVGGNHDSPATLNAPQDLLQALDIQVLGCAPRTPDGEIDYAAEIIPLRDQDGHLQAVFAAVPFLRDRDLKYAQAGETAVEREAAIKQGIISHYATLAEQLQQQYEHTVPFITTGHLFAAGSTVSDSEKLIHVGHLGQIGAAQFPSVFDYVALGHLHQAQVVGGCEHIRYSGSLLSLSFKEKAKDKQVLLVEFNDQQMAQVSSLAIPETRPLLRFKGSLDDICEQLRAIELDTALHAWIEVELDRSYAEAARQLQAAIDNKPLEILKIVLKRQSQTLDFEGLAERLEELTPMDVFRRRCLVAQKTPEDIEVLETHLVELLESVD